jgi:hypothetical protein
MAEDGNCLCSLFCIWLTLLLLGIGYIGTANLYTKVYEGTLIRGSVYQHTTCSKSSCSTSYYVMETFQKGNNTRSTCTVQRFTPYKFYGSAQDQVQNLVLGTKRKLYQFAINSHTCMDESNLQFYNTFGGILLGLTLCVPCLALLLFTSYSIFEEISNNCNNCCQFCTQLWENTSSRRYDSNPPNISYAIPVAKKTNDGYSALEVDNL